MRIISGTLKGRIINFLDNKITRPLRDSVRENIFNLIDKTKFAISNEETRYFLNGLYFSINNENDKSMLTFVGTDGHRLAKLSIPNSTKIDDINGVIIPKKTINELYNCLLYTSPSPRDLSTSRMPSSA